MNIEMTPACWNKCQGWLIERKIYTNCDKCGSSQRNSTVGINIGT